MRVEETKAANQKSSDVFGIKRPLPIPPTHPPEEASLIGVSFEGCEDHKSHQGKEFDILVFGALVASKSRQSGAQF